MQGRESIPAGAMGGTRISTSLRGSPTARLDAEGPRWLWCRLEAPDTRFDRCHDTCLFFQAWKWVLGFRSLRSRLRVFHLRKHNTREQLFTVNRAILLLKSYSYTTCCFLVCKFFFLSFFLFATRSSILKKIFVPICKINGWFFFVEN